MGSNVVPFAKKEASLSDRSDDELMLLASAGVVPAFESLVGRYARRLLAFCMKQTSDRQLGEEMAQEIWLAVWDHRADYRAEGKFVVWLFTLARNRVRNARRDLARRPRPIDSDPEASIARTRDHSPSELDRLLDQEKARRVQYALSGVRDDLRDALVLRFTEELPYEEIAAILDINESTARSRVFHGIRELRRRLKGEP